MESWLFLGLILLVAIFGKNMSLIIATGVVMFLKLIPYTQKWFPVIEAKGINWGSNSNFGSDFNSDCNREDRFLRFA